jgi:hypothetical protein
MPAGLRAALNSGDEAMRVMDDLAPFSDDMNDVWL